MANTTNNGTDTTKTVVAVTMTDTMKTALDAFATQQDKAVTHIVRLAVAKYIKYRMTPADIELGTIGRRRKYESDEDRKTAQKAAYEARKALVNKLLDEHKAKEKEQAIKALQESLDRKDTATQ